MSASGSPEGQRGRSGSLLQAATRKSRHVPITPSKRIQAGKRASMSQSFASGEHSRDTLRPRTGSASSQAAALGRTPNRSFYHRSFHGQLDPAQYSFKGVQEQTAELASLAYSENASASAVLSDHSSIASDEATERPEAIEEVSEPVTPDEPYERNNISYTDEDRAGILEHQNVQPEDNPNMPVASLDDTMFRDEADERTALLADRKRHSLDSIPKDMESQLDPKSVTHPHWYTTPTSRIRSCLSITFRPKSWSAKGIWREAVVHPVSVLPAVFLGLLLNILDALSYGMILFPLGEKIFEDLGSDGIAMFYVSTVLSQLVYSSGGSIFRGGIGSEMIEVVPFMHKMALMILNKVGEENKESVLATTVLSFSISAVLTGAVFFAMGACHLGALIGFFPRHILIGCIGGVGWFLVVTGVEVSARLPGSLEYNLDTLKQLFRADTVALWIVPLVLAIILLITQRYVKSNFLVGGYFVAIAAIFYFFKFALDIQMDTLHDRGWVFDSPPSGNPWYHFWTLYNFKAVDWEALLETLPTMFALTFFGILHVPINVPALGISTGEDNLNVDRELIAHGISNTMSGLCGSVQNYLVYTNSLLFMDSGGNDRLAGLMLAAATFGILLAGPVIIGFIPIMVVGALIFLLGIELLEEALWDTAGKVHRLEYLTILVIVVTMGVWDFVAGILVGIVLAALNFVVQTSRRTAIRAEYSGVIAQSTVRRPPVQLKFLKETGKQIYVLKLAGFLFFGTIVGVENRIRALLAEDAFDSRPLRFVVLDMSSINGIDFSAAEAFTRVNRLLQKRGVKLCISALELDGEIGRALRNVGLFSATSEVEAFETLNQALQNCENKLLSALYRQERQRLGRLARRTSNLDVPVSRPSLEMSSSYRQEFLGSPRQHQLHRAATTTLEEDTLNLDKWSAFKQPLPLIMQIFQDMSDKDEDFWHRSTHYFERACFPKGSVLFEVGDAPQGFYLVEEGLLRADYDLPQGKYSELIVERRPCGELPFFSSTARTANMVAETDCILWVLSASGWQDLQKEEPDIAQEVLKITLKLTKERMDAITSYVMTAAG